MADLVCRDTSKIMARILRSDCSKISRLNSDAVSGRRPTGKLTITKQVVYKTVKRMNKVEIGNSDVQVLICRPGVFPSG